MEKERAHQSLKMYKQGGLPMHTFLAQFENLARKAKYFGEDDYLISLPKPACDRHLVTLIALRENPPTTFKAWKEALMKSDGIRKEVREATRTGYQPPPFRPRGTAPYQRFSRPLPQTRQFFGPNFFRNPEQNNPGLQSSAHPTQGAVTFGGQGQPVIMDKTGQRKCFNCGRPGHISRDCRAPRNNPQNRFTSTSFPPTGNPYENLRFPVNDITPASQSHISDLEQKEQEKALLVDKLAIALKEIESLKEPN
jgi:Zinc knuckle